jgi:hypothetical protein
MIAWTGDADNTPANNPLQTCLCVTLGCIYIYVWIWSIGKFFNVFINNFKCTLHSSQVCIFIKYYIYIQYFVISKSILMALGTITNSQITLTLPSLSFLVDNYAPHEVREFQNYWVNISDLYLGTVAFHV